MAKEILVDLERCLGCKTCELACAVARDSAAGSLAGAVAGGEKPVPRVSVFSLNGEGFPIQCRHCEDAACIAACPAGALRRDPPTGTVLSNADRCVGCWMCVMVCPFGAVRVSGGDGARVTARCDRCWGREEPACVAACPTGALVYAEPEVGADYIRSNRQKALRELGASLTGRKRT